MEHSAVLEEVYGDPELPGSFMSAEKLKRSVKQVADVDVPLSAVQEWLKGKDTYTKHTVARRTFKRNPIIAPHIDAQWQGDLADVKDLEDANDGVTFLLVMIDVVSKYLWVEPLASKHGPVVLEGLKNIFLRAGGRRPNRIQTDQGAEFLNSLVQEFLKKEKNRFFTVKSDKKAAIAEE